MVTDIARQCSALIMLGMRQEEVIETFIGNFLLDLHQLSTCRQRARGFEPLDPAHDSLGS